MLACCPWLQGGAGGGCVDRQQHQRRRSFAACTCVIATPDNPRPALLPRCRCAAAWAPSPLTLTPCAGRQAWPAPPPTARVGRRTPPPTCSTPTPPTSEQSDGHRRPLIYQPQQPGPGCHAAQAQQHAVTFSPQPALQIRFNSAPAWHAILPWGQAGSQQPAQTTHSVTDRFDSCPRPIGLAVARLACTLLPPVPSARGTKPIVPDCKTCPSGLQATLTAINTQTRQHTKC